MRLLDVVRGGLAACLVGLSGISAAVAAPLDDMVAFDAQYIPALALTSAAAADAKAAPKAAAAMQRLMQQWPQLKQRLAAAGAGTPLWTSALSGVERDLGAASAAVRASRFSEAHEALEPVRVTLMRARQQQGLDYFVDRLTAYHEPMEVLALAGSTLRPEQLDAARREELTRAYAQARALWRDIEAQRVDAAAYGLSREREKQFVQAVKDESAALERLSEALRSPDAAALLKSATAIKPPFARAYMAFGQPADEAATH